MERLGLTQYVRMRHVTSASSSPISIILGIFLLVFFAFYKQKNTDLNYSKPVGVRQRVGAFFIDFAVVLSAIVPLITLPILLVEGQSTGAFEWSFIRQFGRPTDVAVILPSVLLMFIALFCYFYLQAKNNRATLGQYILAYKIIAGEGGSPNYFLRTFLSYIGLCVWPISLFFALKRQDKKFWWDSKSRTAAVRAIS